MAQNNGEPSQVSSAEGSAMVVPSTPSEEKQETPQAILDTGAPIAVKCSDLTKGVVVKNGSIFLKTKNYKAGSKINQLADMLAKRSLKAIEISENGDDTVPYLLSGPVIETPSLPPPSAEHLKTDEAVDKPAIPTTEPPPTPPPPPLSPAESVSALPVTPLTALKNSDNSTKIKHVKTRTSPRRRKEVDSIQTDSVVKKGKHKKQVKKSKKLVETSTQTADIQFISLVKTDEPLHSPPLTPQEDLPAQPPPLLPTEPLPLVLADPPVDPPPLTPADRPTFICLFCHLTFFDKTDCLYHEATHSLKRKTKFIKCQFCSKKLPNLEEFKSHLAKHHGPNFHLCMECDMRFLNEESLILHAKLDHSSDPIIKTQFTILNKKVRIGPCLDVDVSFDGGKRQSISPRCPQKLSPKEKTEEQLYEAEMLFYSHLSGNIQENLSKHLDGKIDQFENGVDVAEPSRNSSVLALAPTSSGPGALPPRAPSPYQTRSKTPNPLPTSAKKFKKLPNWQQKFWEKYNFPTNYRFEHRFWDKNYIHTEKSPLYLKDLSCLDIKTQLTMRENVKKLEESTEEIRDEDEKLRDTFPYFLNLISGPKTTPTVTEPVAQSKLESAKTPKKKGGKPPRKGRNAVEGLTPSVVTRRQSGKEGGGPRKGSLDLGVEKSRTLRRRTSLENIEVVKEMAPATVEDASKTTNDAVEVFVETSDISGEWVRPRSYLCGACCAKFTSLWELEDHKSVSHPNVWCTHYEFEDEKLEKLFQLEAQNPQVAQITLPDLYRRYLQPQGSLHMAEPVASTIFPHPCSKCLRPCVNQPELHKHMLDCGGDTTWFLTMCTSPATMKRRWRPYGSRRRKQINQRGVKRNIPTTPTLRSYCPQPKIRTKPGDVESIQKMLANLPEKRTRRAINFDEVNTRSQTTIHSNRLLRKRFNVTFGSNFLRRKALTTVRQRQLKAVTPTESSSNSPSDLSLDATPSASPRRKFRLKEVTVDVIPLSLNTSATLPLNDLKVVGTKKKGQKKKAVVKKLGKAPVVKDSPKEGSVAKAAAEMKLKNLKKRMVARRGYLVKKIKKKLSTSKKLMEESRRRSERIKENQPKEDKLTNSEGEVSIAKMTDKKKTPKKLNMKVPEHETKEMPILNKEEPVKKKSGRKTNPNLPVLKPFEPVESVNETKSPNVVFKVVKKNKKKSNTKVMPLKLVKEVKSVAKTEVAVHPISVKGEVVESVSDSEPLITLKQRTVKKVPKRKKIGRKWSKNKRKPVSKISPDENILYEIKPQERDEEEEEEEEEGEDDEEEEGEEEDEGKGGIEAVKTEKLGENERKTNELDSDSPIDRARYTNLMVEKIITDKLNERIVKKKKRLTHKKGKVDPEHSLKRLRMTVTLKEATLKVLDKPSVQPTPSKWTVTASSNEIVNFEPIIVPTVEEKNDEKDRDLQEKVESEVLAVPVELKTAKPRTRRRSSRTLEIPKEAMEEPKSVVNVEKTPSTQTSFRETSNQEDVEPTAYKQGITENINDATTKKTTTTTTSTTTTSQHVLIEPRQDNLEILPLNNQWKSSEDVSTTVSLAEDTEASSKSIRNRKLSRDEGKRDVIKNFDKPVKELIPIFTIEEATSSEDATACKPTRASNCEARIAEADSSGEKLVTKSIVGAMEPKIEPEMVVSSTEPAKPDKKKRKRKEVVIDFESKDEVPSSTLCIPEELDRRSRRKSKEIPSTNEFIIDEPLLLVDELWSDLDSDSGKETKQKKRVKRVKKKSPKKKSEPSAKVDLEALLRNFGENKEIDDQKIKILPRKKNTPKGLTSRERIERKVVLKENAHKRLSLSLYSFNKKVLRHGHLGKKLLKEKKILLEAVALPKLPFLPSEVTENPEQVIVCRSTKTKPFKKGVEETEKGKEPEKKPSSHNLKISLPLEILGDLSVLNNNHLRAPVSESVEALKPEKSRSNTPDIKLIENKPKRSEVIDKIFYCEICKTYYYSPSQLKNHKMSNRHKLKEAELLEGGSEEAEVAPEPRTSVVETPSATVPGSADIDIDKLGDDTSEMPVLEGPFIETHLEPPRNVPVPVPPTSMFGFSEESLKDIQRAIGCTDEEMLILSLLGENTVPEPDILDISNLTSKAEEKPEINDTNKTNGTVKIDLKQRMTTALASLVNRAVSNLLSKSESATKPTERSDAVSFLNKLSGFSGRRKSFTLADMPLDIIPPPAPIPQVPVVGESSEVRYKYQCTICGNRFEKETTRDFHMVRTHRVGKRSKMAKQDPERLTPPPEEWNDSWYDCDDYSATAPSQFWCSDCGINFLSPKEVLEHQRAEHPPDATRVAVLEDVEPAKPAQRRMSCMDPDQERYLANRELQKLMARRQTKRTKKPQVGFEGIKFMKADNEPISKTRTIETAAGKKDYSSMNKIVDNNVSEKSVDVYDFNEVDSDVEPVVLSHVKKSGVKRRSRQQKIEDEDSEDNLPLSSVKIPKPNVEEPTPNLLTPPDTEDQSAKSRESFKISLQNRFLRLDEIKLKKSTPSCSDEDSVPLHLMSSKEFSESLPISGVQKSDQVNKDVASPRNDSVSSFASFEQDQNRISQSEESSKSESEEENTRTRRQKKIIPVLSATLTNTDRKSESPKLNKEVIVKKIWNRQKWKSTNDESEIDKETIMKKVWKKKKEDEVDKAKEDIKINETQFSNEVVIRCGPKAKNVNRRRSVNENAKDAIVRRIWSGKCGVQTKAALKTYDSDVLPPATSVTPQVTLSKRRGRPSSVSAKRKKVDSASEDDLDSLLEEIEQENVEKAIRLEFLHLRRTEKNQVESKEPTGLFAELQPSEVRHAPEKKKRKIRKNLLLKRRKDINDFRNRHHKKHRHHHHHHKHKHKKSRHHKKIISKHGHKHRPESVTGSTEEPGGEMEPFRVLERMCHDIAPQFDASPVARRTAADKVSEPRISSDLDNLDLKLDEILSPFDCADRVNGDVSDDEYGISNKS